MKKKEKIEEKYFEDIFYPIKNLWKGCYFLLDKENKGEYIKSIANDYNRVDDFVRFIEKKYDVWQLMSVFTVFGTLIDWGLKYIKQGKEYLNIDEIPIEEFEKDYLENLKLEGNEEYLAKYKGLKSRLN
ncbi:hypothetical protein [Apibacter mensalis]|uniref:hypothetical protein n=1 Tax=Apibacter mensalis TaxID=1586267 RepID=UPI0026F2C92A|nr:hypothetical protein [Apibacter mensalis]